MIAVDDNYNITIVRGDSGYVKLSLVEIDGEEEVPYIPKEGETLRFAMAKKYGATEEDCLILRPIDVSTLKLYFHPEDTKNLKFGDYKYDLEFTNEDGFVDTILKATFRIDEEVY